MAVIESKVQGPAEGGGPKIDTVEVTTSKGVVERQVTVQGDPSDQSARAAVKNADPAGADYGAVVRVAGTVPLPTGASTEATLALIKADVDKIPSQGQALAAASMPVVLTAAQVATLTPPAAITGFALDSTVAKDASLTTIDTDIKAAQPRKLQDGAGTSVTVGQKAMAASLPVTLPTDVGPLEVSLSDDAQIVTNQGAPGNLSDAWAVVPTDGNLSIAIKGPGQPATVADAALVVAVSPSTPVNVAGTVVALQGATPYADNIMQVGGQPVSQSLPVAEVPSGPLIDVLNQMLVELRIIRTAMTYMATEGGRVSACDLDPNSQDFTETFLKN